MNQPSRQQPERIYVPSSFQPNRNQRVGKVAGSAGSFSADPMISDQMAKKHQPFKEWEIELKS